MSDVTNELLLEHLKRLQADSSAIRDDMRLVRERPHSVEEQVAGLRRGFTRLEHRIDAMDARVERIERRLDLAEA